MDRTTKDEDLEMNRRIGVNELVGSFGQSRPKFEIGPFALVLPQSASRRTQDYVLWLNDVQERIEGCPGSFTEPGNHGSSRFDQSNRHSSDPPDHRR
jgi:hypothetical protein